MSIMRVCGFFGASATDYGADRGRGVLLSSGAGIMMAVMDQAPALRWCIDLDAMRAHADRIPNLIVALDRNTDCDLIAACGWFSLDDPTPIAKGIVRVRRARVASYFGGFDFPNMFPQFLARCASKVSES